MRVLPVALLLAGCAAQPVAPSALRFSAPEGRALNEFYRRGPVAAHLVLTPGTKPRMVVAFPAGNSGTAVWFDASAGKLSWSKEIHLESAQLLLPDGGTLHGVTAEIEARGTPLSIRQAIVGSVRVIRDYEYGNELPRDVLPPPEVAGNSILLQRRRLDGGSGYYLSIELTTGSVARERERIVLAPDANGRLRMRVTALTGDPPLTPVSEDRLVTASASDARLRRMLTFLAYEEKLLAGSWRFNTYFGRDTLMSVRLLAPVLQPAVMEAGLASVLERLNPAGEVAHEEDIGEFAVLRRRSAGMPPTDEPVYDYKMIDDDFMLPLVAAHYLLDTPAGRERAATFLANRTGGGETYGERLTRNFRFVLAATTPFAREPRWSNLVSLKPGVNVGNWRDSEDGLGGGRYPYDVNGALAPGALAAIARLHASGLLRPHAGSSALEDLASAAGMAEVWRREAPRLFDVSTPSQTARAEILAYARRAGVDASAALEAITSQPVQFRAVSLDAEGRPVRVLNSDEGFALLFLDPPSEEVERTADTLTRPFPAGLLTGVGITVANPVYAPDALEPMFERNRYHGAVIWSWQQALLSAGIERQLRRQDVSASARAALERARARLDQAIAASDAVRGSELWSWSQSGGAYRVEPFGQREEDETESNAAQLWSTVWLASGVRR